VNPTGRPAIQQTGRVTVPLDRNPLGRRDKALALVDRRGAGLEIGPSHNPIAPKAEGFDVHVIDHLDAPGLREKYAGHPVDLSQIEEVDFVWRGEPLPDLVGGRARYDWIIASHVFEHLPDPVSFLAGCEQVLRPGGVVSLVIPDKRYCFDHFRPVTTTGAVLDAYVRRQARPSPGNVFDEASTAVRREGDIGWMPGDTRTFSFVHPPEEAPTRWRRAVDTTEYMDVHLWQFVPESFRLLVHDLRTLGLIGLGVRQAFDTTGHEFHVTLGAEPPGGPKEELDRLGVLHAVFAEAQPVPPAPETPPARAASTPAPDPPSAGRRPVTMEVSDPERRLLLAKRRILEALRTTVGR